MQFTLQHTVLYVRSLKSTDPETLHASANTLRLVLWAYRCTCHVCICICLLQVTEVLVLITGLTLCVFIAESFIRNVDGGLGGHSTVFQHLLCMKTHTHESR
jgi:hypothetical protein